MHLRTDLSVKEKRPDHGAARRVLAPTAGGLEVAVKEAHLVADTPPPGRQEGRGMWRV